MKKKSKKGKKKEKKEKKESSVRNASRDGFDNVLRGLMVASGIGVDIDRGDLRKFYINIEGSIEAVRRTLWTIG